MFAGDYSPRSLLGQSKPQFGLEPKPVAYEATALPIKLLRQAPRVGVEPTLGALEALTFPNVPGM